MSDSQGRNGTRSAVGLLRVRDLLSLTLLLSLVLLSGCGEPEARLGSPKTHRSGGLVFSHPENWRVTEDTMEEGFQNIFVETPGDALVIIQTFPRDGVALSERADAFAADTARELPVGEMTASTFTGIEARNGFERIKEEFAIVVLGETTPHQRVYAAKEMKGRQVYAIFQVATTDRAKVEAGFDQILDSLQLEKDE